MMIVQSLMNALNVNVLNVNNRINLTRADVHNDACCQKKNPKVEKLKVQRLKGTKINGLLLRMCPFVAYFGYNCTVMKENIVTPIS